VQLDASTVVLVLERGAAAVRRQHGAEVVGDLGEHRQQRHERTRRHAGQRRRPAGGDQARDARQVAEKQRGTTHGSDVGAPRGGNGLEQRAFGDSGAHLATDDAIEELPLVRRGARGELRQARIADAAGAGAGGRGHLGEGIGDVAQAQRRPGRLAVAPAPAKAAHTEDARIGGRERPAGQERDRDGNLLGVQGAEEARHLALLVQTPSQPLEAAAQGSELRECRHSGIVLSEFDSSPSRPVG